MSWGIAFNTEIDLKRTMFNSIEDIKGKIEESKENKTKVEKTILMMICSNLDDILKLEESNNSLDTILQNITELMDQYSNESINIYKYKLLLYHLEDKDDKKELFRITY